MDHVPDVDADLDFNPAVGCDVMVTLGQGALDFDGTLRGLQSAGEFDQESVADGLDFGAVKVGKDFAEQTAMFFEQLEGELVVALGQRAVPHHVGKHDGGQFALFRVGFHCLMWWGFASSRKEYVKSSKFAS